MIRFIVETYSSTINSKGEYWHLTKVTSTLSGRTLCFSFNSQDYTTPHIIQSALGLPPDTPVVYAVAIVDTLPIRQWRKVHGPLAPVMHDCTPSTSTLLELEQP